jgi:hypothetical protein
VFCSLLNLFTSFQTVGAQNDKKLLYRGLSIGVGVGPGIGPGIGVGIGPGRIDTLSKIRSVN